MSLMEVQYIISHFGLIPRETGYWIHAGHGTGHVGFRYNYTVWYRKVATAIYTCRHPCILLGTISRGLFGSGLQLEREPRAAETSNWQLRLCSDRLSTIIITTWSQTHPKWLPTAIARWVKNIKMNNWKLLNEQARCVIISVNSKCETLMMIRGSLWIPCVLMLCHIDNIRAQGKIYYNPFM
jgi:hypothetical protein